MRSTFMVVPFLGVALAGCQCSPAVPVPVTFRVINSSADPLYVDATDERLGLTVKRDVLGELFEFDDKACECQTCERVCESSCACDGGTPKVARLGPSQTLERAWDGVVRTSGFTTCTSDGACLSLENAPVNETFVVSLCYSRQAPSGASFSDAGVADALFPVLGQTCVDRRFQIREGVVEIGPSVGAACAQSSDCTGEGELCFAGSCTAGCPANDFPDWNILVGLDNMGFFTQGTRGTLTTFTGSGTISSVGFTGQTLRIVLSRPGTAGESLGGAVTVSLPPGLGPPLSAGKTVAVTVLRKVVDKQTVQAVVMREPQSQALVFVADMAYGGPVLEPSDLLPFTTSTGATPVGCTTGPCGKSLFFPRVAAASGGTGELSLEPGEQGSLKIPAGTYTVVNVSNEKALTGTCLEQRQYLIWRQ